MGKPSQHPPPSTFSPTPNPLANPLGAEQSIQNHLSAFSSPAIPRPESRAAVGTKLAAKG